MPAEAYDYLIVGGGIAGTTAAETIRQGDPRRSICIVSDEPYRLYSRIMLSKPDVLLGKIPLECTWLKEDAWYAAERIVLRKGVSAVRLDTKEKRVALSDGTELSYEKLLLAVGGCARALTVPGIEKKGVFYLRTLDDAEAIWGAMKTGKHGVAVGGGFISFEICDVMRRAGIDTTLILRGQRFWEHVLDERSSRMVESALERGGVHILRNAGLRAIAGDGRVDHIELATGDLVSADLVIIGIGSVCPFVWVQEAGIAVNRGILTNEFLETSAPDVWAAGDAAEYTDLVIGEKEILGNWVNAQLQGKVAGLNMTGDRTAFRKVSMYTSQAFGLKVAFVGDVRPLPDRRFVARGMPEQGSYARFILKGDELVGATLMNRTQELGAITKLIEQDVKVGDKTEELGDPSFNLATLLS